jgi:hypothetical protein
VFKYIKSFFNKNSIQILSNNDYVPIVGKYIQCDPSKPNLIEPQIIYDQSTNYKFCIPYLEKALTKLNDPTDYDSSQRINCAMTLSRSIDVFKKAYLNQFGDFNISWCESSVLNVFIKPSIGWNACYNRNSLQFFYNTDENENVYFACDSAQIVAHECGHGLLDSMRPEFWNVQNQESWAFHEAFSDIVNLMTVSQSDAVVLDAFNENNGDLSKSNCMTRVAGQFGTVLCPNKKIPCLRDFSIKLNYALATTLPANSLNENLSSECHNFSRIFSSAWYASVVAIYNSIKTNESDINAFKLARDTCYEYLLKAVKMTPSTPRLFEALVNVMLLADEENFSKYQNILKQVFRDRKLFKTRIKMLSNRSIDEIDLAVLSKTTNFTYAYVKDCKKIKLSDHVVTACSNHIGHPIFDADLTVASDSVFVYDKNNNLVHEIDVDEKDIIDESLQCVTHILNEKQLDEIWKIENNQLKRIKIDCSFNSRN